LEVPGAEADGAAVGCMDELYTTERGRGRPGFDRPRKRWFNPVLAATRGGRNRRSTAAADGKELAP
jgi:hypothetical protein